MNTNEKIAYLKLLIYVANSDSKYSEDELEYVNNLANLYELSESDKQKLREDLDSKNESIEDLCKVITNDFTKRCLIWELLALSYIDSECSQEEKESILMISKFLSINESVVHKMENLMNENFNLQVKIQEVLRGE